MEEFKGTNETYTAKEREGNEEQEKKMEGNSGIGKQ